MHRIAAIAVCGMLGALLGIAGFALFISLTYPNYHRDIGSTPIPPEIIFGCPGG